jgi:hypothetical protein
MPFGGTDGTPPHKTPRYMLAIQVSVKITIPIDSTNSKCNPQLLASTNIYITSKAQPMTLPPKINVDQVWLQQPILASLNPDCIDEVTKYFLEPHGHLGDWSSFTTLRLVPLPFRVYMYQLSCRVFLTGNCVVNYTDN